MSSHMLEGTHHASRTRPVGVRTEIIPVFLSISDAYIAKVTADNEDLRGRVSALKSRTNARTVEM